jgi:hypothetical protein
MTAILICPADRSGMSLLAEKRPLALAPVLGRTLLDLALAHLAARGFIRVRVLAADRPEMVRASVGRGETWGLQVEVTPETRESSVVEASRKYPDVDPSHIQVLDHLPGHPNLRLFDDLTEGAHGSPGPGCPARAAAVVALVLTALLVVWAWIRHRRAEGPLLRTRQAVRAPLPADERTEVITYRELAGLQGIGRRWPELWEIGGGRLAWVGNRPPSPEQAATLRDDFERLWLSVPSGVISLAELERWGDPMDIQTRIHSSFYAARHGWRDDLRLVALFLRHPFRIAAPVRSSIPQAP